MSRKQITKYIWATSWENLFMPYANNKCADQPAHLRSLISAFVFRCLDSIKHLLAIAEISSLYLTSVAALAGLCLIWSRTPKTGFSWRGSFKFILTSQITRQPALSPRGDHSAKGRVIYYQVGGGGAVTFSCGGQNIWRPPQSLWKKILDPPRYMTKMFVTPPPQPSPQTPLFLSCCFKWGVINIASYHIPKLYSDILSVAKLYSISAVEWADN